MIPAEKALTIKVRQSTFDRLIEASRELGHSSAAAYAKVIFNVGFNLCCRPTRGWPADEVELDEQVKLVMCLAGQADVAAISRATGVREGLVARIFEGFTILRAGSAVMREVKAFVAPAPAPSNQAPGRRRSPETVQTIRTMWAAGASQAEIAAATGSTPGSVSQFVVQNRDICPRRTQGGR